MTSIPIILSMRLSAVPQARLLCPVGMSTPHGSVTGLHWSGGDGHLVADPTTGQHALLLSPTDETLVLDWSYAPGGIDYPHIMFARRDTRFTRAATALAREAGAVVTRAASDPVQALADHVATRFTYGHTDTPFYQDHDEIPQLCDLAIGSCVDINTYFIAACRAAGIEAGYVTGCFIPRVKQTHCSDMHCWVVTRCQRGVREWDIAHHLKIGRHNIRPGLNPRPGVRVPLAHSMGLTFPSVGISDLKLLGEPLWLDRAGAWQRTFPDISFQGYAILSPDQSPTRP